MVSSSSHTLSELVRWQNLLGPASGLDGATLMVSFLLSMLVGASDCQMSQFSIVAGLVDGNHGRCSPGPEAHLVLGGF